MNKEYSLYKNTHIDYNELTDDLKNSVNTKVLTEDKALNILKNNRKNDLETALMGILFDLKYDSYNTQIKAVEAIEECIEKCKYFDYYDFVDDEKELLDYEIKYFTYSTKDNKSPFQTYHSLNISNIPIFIYDLKHNWNDNLTKKDGSSEIISWQLEPTYSNEFIMQMDEFATYGFDESINKIYNYAKECANKFYEVIFLNIYNITRTDLNCLFDEIKMCIDEVGMPRDVFFNIFFSTMTDIAFKNRYNWDNHLMCKMEYIMNCVYFDKKKDMNLIDYLKENSYEFNLPAELMYKTDKALINSFKKHEADMSWLDNL